MTYEEVLDFETEDMIYKRAQDLLNQFKWSDVFDVWNNYLHERCKKPKDVINFAHLFWWYGGQEKIIENPYEFLAYFYYIIGFDTQKYDHEDILDSIATTILPRAGYSEADTFFNTRYIPENDERLIDEVNKLKCQQ